MAKFCAPAKAAKRDDDRASLNDALIGENAKPRARAVQRLRHAAKPDRQALRQMRNQRAIAFRDAEVHQYTGCRNRAAVPARQHQHCADDDLLAVRSCGAGAKFAAELNLREIANQNRHAVAHGHSRLADLIDGADASIRSHKKGLASPIEEVGAHREVGALKRFGDEVISKFQG